MSNPYPSRRELRLQRERAERAKLREAEIKRWTDENDKREKPLSEIPLPKDMKPAGDQDDAVATALGAAATPVAEPAEESATETVAERRRRRADSEVVSTGMIPIISKPRQETKAKPRSRREARQLEASRAAQRRAEVERLKREQGDVEEPKRRRATAPQTTPPPVPNAPEPAPETPPAPQPQESHEPQDDVLDVEVTATHDLSATEITDMSGLDTIEIRRAELRAETERLTQEIIELGESNPNVIDPKLLRRQKELAEKSQELQDLETAAIEIVEAENRESPDSIDVPTATSHTEEVTAPESSEVVPEPDAAATAPQETFKPASEPTRGRRRRSTTQGPFVSGPFEVTEEDDTEAEAPVRAAETKKPPLAEFIRAPSQPEPERDPREPVEASSAHGLDTLNAKDVEAPERRLQISAIIMFAIGILALIVAIILLTR